MPLLTPTLDNNFFSHCPLTHRSLPSFPTRRSSDLSNGESSTMYPPPLYTRWADPPAKIPLTMNWSSAPFVPTASCPVSKANEAESFTDAVRSPTASYATHRYVASFITSKLEARKFPGIAPRSTAIAPAHSPGVIVPSTVGGDEAQRESMTSPE